MALEKVRTRHWGELFESRPGVSQAVQFVSQIILFVSQAVLFVSQAVLFVSQAILFVSQVILFVSKTEPSRFQTELSVSQAVLPGRLRRTLAFEMLVSIFPS